VEGLLSENLLTKASVFGSGGNNIKSIQRGVVTLPVGTLLTNVTISTIKSSDSVVIISSRASGNDGANELCIKAKITSSTNLELSRYGSTVDAVSISWQVIEFTNIKSLQKGDYTFASQGEVTTTISPINTSKSIILFSFKTAYNGSGSGYCVGKILDSTTIAFSCLTSLQSLDTHWQVVEFN